MAEARDSDFPRTSVRVLLTAAEGNAVLERAFLASRREIWASFGEFPLDAALLTPEARALGGTWRSLIEAVLQRGVALHISIADHDPLADPQRHAASWRAARQMREIAERTGTQEQLDIRVVGHAARGRLIMRILRWIGGRNLLSRAASTLNALAPQERDAAFGDMPGLGPLLRRGKDGIYSARFGRLAPVILAGHRQELCVIDRERLFLGGVAAVTEGQPDRLGCLRIMKEGPAVVEAQSHIEAFIAVSSGQGVPNSQRRLLRTMSRQAKRLISISGREPLLHEFAAAHETLAYRAKSLIYIETVAFEDLALARALALAAEENRKLGLVLILPSRLTDEAPARRAAEQQDAVLRELARGFNSRLFVGQVTAPWKHRDPHMRVSIFDARAAIVGSASLTRAGLRHDTETGLYMWTKRDVAELQRRVLGQWLPRGAGAEYLEGSGAVNHWRIQAEADAERAEPERLGGVLPYPMN